MEPVIIKITNKEEWVDLESLLTYCSLYHPSSELQNSARKIIKDIYEQKLFPMDDPKLTKEIHSSPEVL